MLVSMVIILLMKHLTLARSSKDTNLIHQIRDKVRVSMSNPYNDWTADKAIDGNKNTEADAESCLCCTACVYEVPNWWRLNLGLPYFIQSLTFIGRSDDSKQSRNFNIYNGFSNASALPTLLYNNTATTGYTFTVEFSPPVLLQQLEITKKGVLTICELELFEMECEPGRYGLNCSSHCHCRDVQYCQTSHGTCLLGGCEAGWNGQNCSIACESGTFGQNCSSTCHCPSENTCHHVNGSCASGICAPGWKGENCSLACAGPAFGQNCNSTCHCLMDGSCDHITGSCLSGICEAGWQGKNCSLACVSPAFGLNCTSTCHCLMDRSCDPVNGICPSGICAAGWLGENCSIVCESPAFGQNCSSTCHCLMDGSCDHINGICLSGICAAGWQGENCSLACESPAFGQNCSSTCHCFNGELCNHINGICSSRICAAGWQGENCSLECEKGTFGQNCSEHCQKCLLDRPCDHINGSCPGSSEESDQIKENGQGGLPVTTVVVPVLCILIALSVVAGVVFHRKRMSHKPSQISSKTYTDIQELTSERTQTKPSSAETTLNTQKPIQDNENSHVPSGNVYYAFCTKENIIPVLELWEYINLAKHDNFEKIYQDFQKLPVGLVHVSLEARRKENLKKNRYKGVFAYDHSRVILDRADPTVSTYINASFIDGHQRPKQFIAAQGPQESTVDDFWEMIFQQQSSIIVMLTNVIENGVRKCSQYWPIEENEEIKFGDISVSTQKIKKYPDYIVRELEITKAGKKTMHVTQAHFTAWPDKDVPDEAWQLVNFGKKVRTLSENTLDPVVVHCSAGIGRTGTFIALDILYEQACVEDFIQPQDIVTKMRQQRMNMVQTKDQYLFLHEAVAEALYLGVKPIQTRDFEAMYELLVQTSRPSSIPGLKQQFWFVEGRRPAENDSEYCNVFPKEKNDEHRPKGAATLIVDSNDLCCIQNYDGKNMFLTISSELQDELLWSLVLKHSVKTVVSLNNRSGDRIKSGQNWHIDCREGGLKLLDVIREKHFVENTVEIMGNNMKTEDRLIRHFVFLMWHEGSSTPSDSNSVLDLLNAVQRWQPLFDEAHPILVQCEAENDRSGLICALLCEFERIRMKDEINILATVKNMKKRNPRLIPDYAQYEFLHSTVLEYIRQSDVYMNV